LAASAYPRGLRNLVSDIAGDEGERNFQALETFGDGKALFANQTDIEQGEIWRPACDHVERCRNRSGDPHRGDPKA
jgi:hypothetical protein